MKLNILSILLCFLLCQASYSQSMQTGKIKFRLNNVPVEEKDTEPPFIEIIAPVAGEDDVYTSTDADLDLIGQVTDESGINFVSVDSKISEINNKGIFTFPLHLEPGPNFVKLVAMDEERNMQEQTINIQYVPSVVTLADRISETSKYYALIIGIDRYRDGDLPDLENPIRDAEKLYDVLVSKYLFEKDNVKFLKNATRAEIITGLDELYSEVTPDDNLLIFYAGHGWWDEETDNGYWLPSDAERNVKTNWVRNSAVVDYLKEIKSRHTLLITDACFGGSIFLTRGAFPDKQKAFEILYDLPSRKAMTSGNLTEVPDRSAFTEFLVERLNDNDQTYLSSEQLFSSLKIAVINNSDAVPRYGEIGKVGDQGGDFIFVKRK